MAWQGCHPFGCREVGESGKNGFLTPLYDHIELAEALKRLILDSDLRKEFGLHSRSLVLENFDVKKVLAKTELIYKEVIGNV